MDLIDRQAAIDALRQREWLTEDAKEILEDVLTQLPSAQPERKGKWLNVSMDYGECSECGHYGITTNFCPVCGADMRGEDHDT